MEFDVYEQGKLSLYNEDNIEWYDKITCWMKKEKGYNIYVFQVRVDNQTDIVNIYESISAAIAVYFQSNLKKTIEKWNIYLIFECPQIVDWSIKSEVEQDKFAVRKIVWDKLKKEQINDREYILKRLLSLNLDLDNKKTNDKEVLVDIIREKDLL